MRYIVETDLRDFDFWGGAVEVAKLINYQENADECWEYLEGYFDENEEPTETQINDFVWFDAEDLLYEGEIMERED